MAEERPPGWRAAWRPPAPRSGDSKPAPAAAEKVRAIPGSRKARRRAYADEVAIRLAAIVFDDESCNRDVIDAGKPLLQMAGDLREKEEKGTGLVVFRGFAVAPVRAKDEPVDTPPKG